jgi:hypothetical protein
MAQSVEFERAEDVRFGVHHGIHGTMVAGPSGANGTSINHNPPASRAC